MRVAVSFLFSFILLTHVSAQPDKKAMGKNDITIIQGGIVRGDSSLKKLALVFTGDEYGEGLPVIFQTLRKNNTRASFFFTGRFYRIKEQKGIIQLLHSEGHYLGPHADQHLLYCDWTKRDSLLVTKDSFERDIVHNLETLKAQGLPVHQPHYFIPPYEWWNDSIALWSKENGLRLASFTPGIRTNADYTFPQMGTSYKSSEWIMNWLREVVATTPSKLNGAIVLIHAGTDPRRRDKLYNFLEEIIVLLKKNGFQLERIDSLLDEKK
jgi:peptidoglycan/xylan/chitin deacetylase (PgdA/CDA1 family)